jgi:E3 ubiquitin-protein ligase HUWE1
VRRCAKGVPDAVVEDLRSHTDYHGYTVDSLQIQWFWRAAQSFLPEQRARLVQFVTGTSKVSELNLFSSFKVPLEGFGGLVGMSGPQRFNIHRVPDPSRLPTSHTCFNQLDLPTYATYVSQLWVRSSCPRKRFVTCFSRQSWRVPKDLASRKHL